MKKKRLKTSSGIVASFGYYQLKDNGKWKICSCGSLRIGKNPVQTAFAPFELSNAVFGSGLFDTEDEVLQYIRRI